MVSAMKIQSTNPIHRLSEIIERMTKLALQLEPFYEAQGLLLKEGEQPDYEALEQLPAFRTLWLEKMELDQEKMRIMMRLALSFEVSPIDL
jgi:hypothetical protein